MVRALVVAAALVSQALHADGIDPRWVFVSEVHWVSPPTELEKTYDEGDAIVAVLFPSGKLAVVSATLFRDRDDGHVSLCEGCGVSLRLGSWRRASRRTLVIKSHWAHRDVPVDPLANPSPLPDERWALQGQSEGRVAASIDTPAGALVPLPSLRNLEALARTIVGEGNERPR